LGCNCGKKPDIGIVNVHNADRSNVGDWHCAPASYFPEQMKARLHILSGAAARDRDVILGGGGLLNEYFRKHVSGVLANAKRVVGWGVGHNEHGAKGVVSYPDFVDKFKLLGVRDWNCGHEYVPCVSCLSPLFDKKYEIKHEVVLFDHKGYPAGAVAAGSFPTMTNKGDDMAAAIEFIASGGTVITSSYHGAYWAMLLGRKVIVFEPFSSKFYSFKHPPIFCDRMNWQEKHKQADHDYSGFLQECRDINMKFAEKVWEVLK
jgi:hypothetical protein